MYFKKKECRLYAACGVSQTPIDIKIWGNNIDWDNSKTVVLYSDDMHESNSFFNPQNVVPQLGHGCIKDGKYILKKHSLTVITAQMIL